MKEKSENDRIIGDFAEINSEITQNMMNSKLPKFIANFFAKRQRNKLLKSVNKLRKSNYILNMLNIAELFCYTYNNFPPYGNFGSISMSKINNDSASQIEGIIKHKYKENNRSLKAVISIDKSEDQFDLNIYNDMQDSFNNYHIRVSELKTTNETTKDIVNELNKILLNDICDYVTDLITKYI